MNQKITPVSSASEAYTVARELGRKARQSGKHADISEALAEHVTLPYGNFVLHETIKLAFIAGYWGSPEDGKEKSALSK
jgi:hypothetical protein